MGRFIKVLHTCERYANICALATETETNMKTKTKAKMKTKLNRRLAWQLLITFCVGVCVCVCQLHVYDKPSDRQLEKQLKGVVTAELAKRK